MGRVMIWIHGRDDYAVKVQAERGRVHVDRCGLVTLQGNMTYKGFDKIRLEVLEDEFYPEACSGSFDGESAVG